MTDGGIPDVDEWVGADCPECGVEIGAGSIRNTGYALEHKNPEAHPQAGHHVITETVVDDDGVATDGGRDLGEFCDRVEFADHDREPLVQAASALRSAADEFEAHASRREDPLEAIDERIAKLERVLAQGPYGTVGRTRTDGGSPGDGTDWSTYPNPLDTIPDWTETDSVPLTEQADIDLDPALVSELRRIDRQSAADGRVVEVSDGLLQIKLSYDLSTGGDE